ncbi:TPA: NAD-dependent malic enzyme [Legionella pneumophila]|uniref:malate dehydrogenase (oxaloacetate-decarboxylating) n=1 Tax=Legionella pneumophila subsp. pneumophila (strain Philadelphia 1 / ATCC 33152 / DSM 7513) TaxID=272624 RepID=Q5ZRB1_LEGPH|nr:NAD-dependent malic enzyme [Legionella pneumophila]AAU29017.1 malate dehydrogenase (NAD-linked), malic enzyme [Legionella pneumophila subsp. pneumophila str. Philadelphia 1]AEW53196.1 malate dehydrogenase (NAD-linked), malic enzyme [Legionella pneumophila subsp. pneumophila ATCC 43290]AGN15892.1 malate dehydrogenase [Legionella pneumophila subsp. pneumophila str. Thunder Bay]AOU05956.1 NAD-dependent malic enzyme [Legionella pneumophila]AOU08921.1 NAD-dependent malic enzyme [Legionella pneum
MAIKVTKRGMDILRDPILNKGTAFSLQERDEFALHGLIPTTVETLEQQVVRCLDAYSAKEDPLEKHIYLRALQDRNEVLFYRFIIDNLVHILPIIYTPVVGQACEMFSHIYRQPRGVFLSYPERDKLDSIIQNIASTRSTKVIVVTDGERILGLGDQGAGGLGIPIGKLSLYTSCGGIHPSNTLPIILDVGTNNKERLDDPEYIGWRHARISGKEYDDFVDQFVQSIKRHMPHVLLQFEDFAQQHAYPLLERYKNQLCTFNDDIQGTASVAVAAILAATRVTNTPLKEHRVALLGAGSAGCGISEQLVHAMMNQGLSEEEARSRFYLVDRYGLLHDEMTDLLPFQKGFVRSSTSLQNWKLEKKGEITLTDVINNAQPTILLGVSGQPNQFKEAMIKTMLSYCERPIIFPLSNPTSRAEAIPQDLLNWTAGKALIATGSPFEPVVINGHKIEIAQCNNSYIFPGVGLGVVAGQAKRVTDLMMMAAAVALSELAPAIRTGEGRLLPELNSIREVSQHIARAVILQGIKEGHIEPMNNNKIDDSIKRTMWTPQYEPYVL